MAKVSHRIKYGMTKSQVERQLVTTSFLGRKVPVHKKVLKNFQAVNRRIRAYEKSHGLKPYVPKQIGTYVYRTMRGSNSLSEHALGVAMDLDWATNGMTRGTRYKTTIPSYVINIFKLCGFDWGGDWRSIYDPMHVQIGDGIIKPFNLLKGGIKNMPKKTEKEQAIAWVKGNNIINIVNESPMSREDVAVALFRYANNRKTLFERLFRRK